MKIFTTPFWPIIGFSLWCLPFLGFSQAADTLEITQLNPTIQLLKADKYVVRQAEFLITSQQDWNKVLQNIRMQIDLKDEVNFKIENVILLYYGKCETTGFKYIVQSQKRKGSDLKINLLKIAPGKRCKVEEQVNYPVFLYKFHKTAKPVYLIFNTEETTDACK